MDRAMTQARSLVRVSLAAGQGGRATNARTAPRWSKAGRARAGPPPGWLPERVTHYPDTGLGIEFSKGVPRRHIWLAFQITRGPK